MLSGQSEFFSDFWICFNLTKLDTGQMQNCKKMTVPETHKNTIFHSLFAEFNRLLKKNNYLTFVFKFLLPVRILIKQACVIYMYIILTGPLILETTLLIQKCVIKC